MIDETPAIWREKIDKSTDGPLWDKFDDKGGYTVHPVPIPVPINILEINNINLGGNNQNLILFIRGKAISGAPKINGIK